MPIIDPADPRETSWIKDARRVVGLPLHPSGEMSVLDFYMDSSSIADQRGKLYGSRLQLVSNVMMSCIIVRNFFVAAKMVIKRPRVLAPWCCMTTALLGSITAFVSILMQLGLVFNCRDTVWTIGFGMSIANFSNGLIVLQKAYLVLYRKKWIIYVSIPLMLMQVCYIVFIMLNCYATLDPDYGCIIHYPYFIIWYWFASTVPLNVIFSSIFCYVSYKQYKLYGSDAWKRLAKEGIQTMCLAVFCNVGCCTAIALQIGGTNADLFFPLDWMIVNIILLRHCQNMSRNTSSSHQPKTEYILNLSQIATAVSVKDDLK
ncbi:hypothetical protein BDF22DRAFT_143354 [Syncephalis plumigaleata]|nr:hypothetical protein BDF22DRAFT_143354 [Syncephalis plumigaleata]